MKKKQEIQEELNELSPFIAKLKKENNFQVPPNYFDKMQREVIDKTNRMQGDHANAEPSRIDRFLLQLTQLLQPKLIAGLASIALLAGAFYFMLSQNDGTGEPQFADVSMEELEQYLTDNIDELDDELLLEISGNDLSETNILESLDYNDEDVDILLNEIIDELDDEALEELL